MARALLVEDHVFQVTEADLNLTIPTDPEAVYHLRPLTVEKAREIARQFTRYRPNKITHQQMEEKDEPGMANATLDYVIVNWEGVTNGANPAPCDLAHKKMLPAAVQGALIERAQFGQVRTEEEREDSFRQPARVV